MASVLTEEAIQRIFSMGSPLNVFGYMPQVEYLNNPSMELFASFPSMKPLNQALKDDSENARVEK